MKALGDFWNIDEAIPQLERAARIEQSAFNNGLALARPVPTTGGGGCTALLKDGDGRQVLIRVHPWIAHLSTVRPPVSLNCARWAGRLIASLHKCTPTPQPLEAEVPLTVRGRGFWLARSQSLSDISLASRLSKAIPLIGYAESLLLSAMREPLSLVNSHRDMCTRNILRLPQGSWALVDWDIAGPVGGTLEVTSTALELAGWGHIAADSVIIAEFMRGYRDAQGDFEVSEPPHLALAISTQLDRLEFGTRPGPSGLAVQNLAILLDCTLNAIETIDEMCALLFQR